MGMAQGKQILAAILFILSSFACVRQSCSEESAIPVEENLEAEKVEQRPSDYEVYKFNYGIFQYGTKNRYGNTEFIKFQVNLTKNIVEGTLFEIPAKLDASYTLKALWDICRDSAPVEDYFHNPEIFLLLNKDAVLNARIGIEHESNGKAGPESRGWNQFYVQPRLVFNLHESPLGFHSLGIYLKAWHKFSKNRNNDDVEDYSGYGEVSIKTYGDKHNLFLTHSRGQQNGLGTTLLEYMVRIGNGWSFYVQLLDGYEETMVDYKKRNRRAGAGISLLHF